MIPHVRFAILGGVVLLVSMTPASTTPPDPTIQFGDGEVRVQSNVPLTTLMLELLTCYSQEVCLSLPTGAVCLVTIEDPNEFIANCYRIDAKLLAADGSVLAAENAISIDRIVAYEHAIAMLARRLSEITCGQ